jgi:hypothetical protein
VDGTVGCGPEPGKKDTEISISSTDGIAESPTGGDRIRLIVFRVLAMLAGLFFLVAVVVAVPAPWVLLQPDDPHAAENRWFVTVAGAVDAIAVVVLLAARDSTPLSVTISSLPLSKGCSVARVRVMRMGLPERLRHEAKHAVGQTSVVAP